MKGGRYIYSKRIITNPVSSIQMELVGNSVLIGGLGFEVFLVVLRTIPPTSYRGRPTIDIAGRNCHTPFPLHDKFPSIADHSRMITSVVRSLVKVRQSPTLSAKIMYNLMMVENHI